MDQLPSHKWLTASSYMAKYLRISSYIRKPFLIYYVLCNCSILNFLIYEENLIIFLSVCTVPTLFRKEQVKTIHTVGKRSLSYCQYHRAEKSIGEIGGVYFALSAGEYTTTLLVMVDRMKGGGRATPHSHQAVLNLPSWWNVCQKVAICGQFLSAMWLTICLSTLYSLLIRRVSFFYYSIHHKICLIVTIYEVHPKSKWKMWI